MEPQKKRQTKKKKWVLKDSISSKDVSTRLQNYPCGINNKEKRLKYFEKQIVSDKMIDSESYRQGIEMSNLPQYDHGQKYKDVTKTKNHQDLKTSKNPSRRYKERVYTQKVFAQVQIYDKQYQYKRKNKAKYENKGFQSKKSKEYINHNQQKTNHEKKEYGKQKINNQRQKQIILNEQAQSFIQDFNRQEKNIKYTKRQRYPPSRPAFHNKQIKYKNNDDNYRSKLKKYMENYFILTIDRLEQVFRKLKKTILQCYPQAKQIQMYGSNSYPMFMVEFRQTANSNKITMKHFGELLRQNRRLKQKRSLFQDIYQRLFMKVDKKYYNIAVFFLHKAKQIQSSITKQHIFNLEQGHDVMFYYMKENNNKINFIIFDCFLRYIQMTSLDIQDLKKQHPDEFKIYLKFVDKIKESNQQEKHNIDIFDKQQASSDEQQRPNFEERPLNQLKFQLQRILNKDLTEQQQRLEDMNNQLFKQAQNNSDNDRFKVLEQKTQDLQTALDLFFETRDSILNQYSLQNQNSKQFMKKGLKKMIIAEKQLQSGLPIIGKKRKIFQMLKKQNLLIIEGQTGSGKSTQLPQILGQFYQLYDDGKARPVLVTQPRRLATRSLAERVAKQMGQTVGGFVDYVASAGKQVSLDAKIIFKLDRIVLDELTEDPILSKYSCLVIDQAHERTISIDVILGLIKNLLEQRKDFKIIVTSASMDIQLFQKYFNTKTLRVSGRMFPVKQFYRDYKNFKQGDKYQTVRKIQKCINEEILTTSGNIKKQYKGHLLCFCSQIDQIQKLVQVYEKKLNPNMFSVLPLHGKISPTDQKKVFQDNGKIKFIFASRIAQTAITIDGVKVVIDPGKDLELIYDQKYKYSSMKLLQITKSSAKQRLGRAGRTGPGFCFRLYSQQSFKNRQNNKTPEIQNSSLQTVVLRLKTLRIRDVINFPYISKPSRQGLVASLQLLTLIGTLSGLSQEVTKIGHLLVKIPIEPFLSRAIIESMMFEVVLQDKKFVANHISVPQKQLNSLLCDGLTNSIISILALVVNFSNLFFIRKDERQTGQSVKYQFSDEQGDFFFLDNIYKKFKMLQSRGNRNATYQWVNNNFLSFKTLNQTQDLIHQIQKIISGFTIDPRRYEEDLDKVKSKLRYCNSSRQIILSCLITSFSPNICKFSGNSHIGYTMVSQRKPLKIYGMSNLDLLGKNPQWIVCNDLHTNQSGRLYCKLAHQINYEFMKKHLDTFIWRKFEIQKINKNNPFYHKIEKQLPTNILQQFRFDYNKSQNQKKYQFLKNSYPLISQEQNKVTFFIELTNDERKDRYIIEDFQEQIDRYQINIVNKSMNQYRHNYIGNVFARLFDGFQIQNIEFDNQQFCFQIKGPLTTIEIIEQDSLLYGVNGRIEFIARRNNFIQEQQIARIKIFITNKINRQQFQRYLDIMKYNENSLQIKETLTDKRRKIPKTKIFIHYFAGTSQKDFLYAHYDLMQQDGLSANDMCDLIKDGIRKGNYHSKLNIRDLKTTKKGNGINIRTSYDEFQIAQQLYQMDKNGLFQHNFKMPKFIRKFRDPQLSEAKKNNQEWKLQINKMIDSVKVKRQNIIINIRGTYRLDKKSQQKLSAFQKQLRVDMNAQIITLDNTLLQKLRSKYDGRQGIIGCQKVHVRAKYQQLLATCSAKAFEALQDEYKYQLGILKAKYPLLMFDIVHKLILNKYKTFIYAHSPNREDFIEPIKTMSNLFTPKLLKLQYSEFRFLNKMQKGVQIIEDIEGQYGLKIYFGFDSLINCMRIYCHDNDFKQIENKLKSRIAEVKYYTQKISYRGKNLNKVKQVIKKYQQDNSNEKISYEIVFGRRQIMLTSNLQTFQNIKNQILKIVESEKGQCNICADVMRTPYRLMNCGQQFCWLCLAQHVRMFRNASASQKLNCPNVDCKQLINIYDVKTLISEEQFQKICDIKISKYLQVHQDKFLACKYCENVFDRKDIEKEGQINCQICGKIECLKCNESHPNYTCQQWKEKDNNKAAMQKMGVRQCPKCKTGIIKNGGCNHMECRGCKTHICWKCFKIFATSKECYDHLARQCGGIFDPI